jgi:hypothetical protein
MRKKKTGLDKMQKFIKELQITKFHTFNNRYKVQ